MTMPMLLAAGASMRGAYTFAEAMNQVAATAQLSEQKMTPYNDAIREFGRTTQFTAVDAANGFNYLLQAGLDLDEAMAILPTTLELAAASNMSLAKAADVSTNAFAGFAMASGDVTELKKNMVHLNDVVAYTATKANTNVPQLFMAMKEAAPISAALGISLEKTAAILGDFGNKGFQGSAAGRSFRTGLLRLIAPTKKARAAFAGLGIEYSKFFSEKNTLSGDKLSRALNSQGMNVKAGLLQDILENSESEDLLGELVDKVVGQIGDTSAEARIKISQTIADSLAANMGGLDVYGLFAELKANDAGAAHLEAIFGKMQVAKFMAIMNGELGKGYIALEKELIANADGAAKEMSETRMRGMVGGLKRFQSAVEGVNLSIWDSSLADEMAAGLNSITGAIRNLDDDDVKLLVSAGKAIGGVVLAGAAITGIANVGGALATLGGALSKAAIGALAFSPYVVAGGAFLLGLGYLADAYQKEGLASKFAARSEQDHADQLERVDKVLGRTTKNSTQHAANLDAITRHGLRIEIDKTNKQLVDQRAEISGNLMTSGYGSSNLVAALPDDIKENIDSLNQKWKDGTIGLKDFNAAILDVASTSIEAEIALDTVIKNVRGYGAEVAAQRARELQLNPQGYNSDQISAAVDAALTVVSLKNNTEYQHLLSIQTDTAEAVAKVMAMPIAKGKSHFFSLAAPQSGFGMLSSEQERDDKIASINQNSADTLGRIAEIEAAYKQQTDAVMQLAKQPVKLEGQADVNINVSVEGGSYQSSVVENSGHVNARVNTGTSSAWARP
ncbi:MAG: phage tail tape measure protein [Rhizobiales bacterium]|nr:phage tail tape measure protein [Hyphomicrobiales bacterium]NRB13107.1 phage tail tape measure protein [Hyphomicrobiales bacterium]